MDNQEKFKKNKKRLRFEKLAEQRTNNVLKSLKVLGNCGNQNIYEYSKQDVEKIFNTILEVIEETKGKFSFWQDKDFKL